MTILSPQQIGVLVYANQKWGPGGSKEQVVQFLDTAIAVAMAESGGNTNAKNPSSSASGLYQIMVSVHKDKIGGRDIFDPVVNIDVARMVWEEAGKSWKPWVAYTSGSYKKYSGYGAEVYDTIKGAIDTKDKSTLETILGSAYKGVLASVPGGAAISGALSGPIDSVTGAASNVLSGPAQVVAGAVSDAMRWIAKGFAVVLVFSLAVTLLALGVWFLVSNTKAGKQVKESVESGVTKAVTKGVV